MNRKRKPPFKPKPGTQLKYPTLSPQAYHALIDHELNRLSSPVERIDPATIDYAALDVSIAQAQAKNRRR